MIFATLSTRRKIVASTSNNDNLRVYDSFMNLLYNRVREPKLIGVASICFLLNAALAFSKDLYFTRVEGILTSVKWIFTIAKNQQLLIKRRGAK